MHYEGIDTTAGVMKDMSVHFEILIESTRTIVLALAKRRNGLPTLDFLLTPCIVASFYTETRPNSGE